MPDFLKLWEFFLSKIWQVRQWFLGDPKKDDKSSHTSTTDPDRDQSDAAMNKPAVMDAETRSYHEGFMREAIAMVRPTRWRS